MMSNPAVHSVTAAVSHRMRGSSDPRMAIHAAAGAAILLLGYYSAGFSRSYEESIDHPPPPISREAEIAAAVGVVFGFTYWLIAGRNAGRWRGR